MQEVYAPRYRSGYADSKRFDLRSLALAIAATAILGALLVYYNPSGLVFPSTDDDMTAVSLPLRDAVEEPDPPKTLDPQYDVPIRPVSGAPEARPISPPAPPVSLPNVPIPPIELTPELVPTTDFDALEAGLNTAPGSDVDALAEDSAGGTGGTGDLERGGEGAGGGAARRLYTVWAPEMQFSWLRKYYPREARKAGQPGLAVLECTVLERSRVRDCTLLGTQPEGQGFGQAALDAQSAYRIHVYDGDGERVYGERVIVNAYFNP